MPGIEYKWVDCLHTDPNAAAAALNAAGAEGWVFGWISNEASAHTRVWLTRMAPEPAPEPETEPEPEAETETRRRR
jgi:hypothetical protein